MVYFSYLTLQFLVVVSDSLWPRLDCLMDLSRPVDLIHTNHNLTRPLTNPLDTRIYCVRLEEISKIIIRLG